VATCAPPSPYQTVTATKRTLPTSEDLLKRDFRNFLWVVWKHLNLPEPTPIQNDIASFLQHGPNRAVIEAFRGVGKSFVTSAYVCWRLYCNPDTKILVVSATKSRSDDFTTFTLQLIRTVPILQHLIPRTDQRASMVSFDVGPARPDQSPSVKSVSIFGQLAGTRADEIIADDVEIANNSFTQLARERLSDAVREFDAILKPGGKVRYLGTPSTENSLYSTLEERGYVIRIWTARYPSPEQRERYGYRLAFMIGNAVDENPSLVGKTTEPRRFSDEDLMMREASWGRQGFALQFMLDTTLSDVDRYPLKTADLIVFPLDPQRGPTDLVWASGPAQIINDLPSLSLSGDRFHRPAWIAESFTNYEGSVMFIDPSGRGKDETAYAIVKALHGRMFLADAGGFLGGYTEDTLKRLLQAASLHRVTKILAEPNYGGGMFTALLRGAAQRYYPCTVEDADWSKGPKEARIIDTLEPVLLQHRLVIDAALIAKDAKEGETKGKEYSLIYQLTRLTSQRGALTHDDRVEAVAGAVSFWERQLSKSTEQANADYQDRMKDEALAKFLQGVRVGVKDVSDTSWSSGTMKSMYAPVRINSRPTNSPFNRLGRR
jgi:hypothetical protein